MISLVRRYLLSFSHDRPVGVKAAVYRVCFSGRNVSAVRMKQPVQENPYAYGYARMPRIIRKGYQNLTNLQKLLYIYIRDLCGEDGVCYRSLRSLKEETGFSIGYLATNIPVLHNEDLIHATMRKHHGTGWEIWHISIVDIWEKNAAFIQAEKEKCSQDEQIENQSVHAMNKSVHHMNTFGNCVHVVNESVHAMILNRESNRELPITENTKRELESGANAPTRTVQFKAAMHASGQLNVIEEKITDLQSWKEDTGKHKAVQPSSEKQHTPSSRSGSHDDAALVDPPAGASSTSSDGPRASGRSQAPLSNTKEIQGGINEHRGYGLEEKVEIIRERQAIKSWCSLHTAEEYEQVMQRLRTDPYWGKDENYSRIGGVNLAKETPKALASLKRNGTGPPEQEEVDEDYSDFDRYVGNGKEEREALYQEGLERQRNGTLIW